MNIKNLLYAIIAVLIVSCSKDDGQELSPAKFSIDQSTVDFGEVESSTQKDITVTVNNTGEQDLVLKNYTLSGSNASEFSVDASETEKTVQAGKTYEFTITFEPTEAGDKTATLTITSNVGEHKVNLSGNASLGANAIVNIPDANFKASLIAHGDGITGIGISTIDTNNDGEIQIGEAQAYEATISCVDMGITDLTGIESFVNMKELVLLKNQLTSLDVSKNTALEKLVCDENELTSLDLSNNTALIQLWVQRNKLTSLDISQNVALERLICDNNQLTSLDVSNNTSLKQIWAQNNALTSLDVSQNVILERLYLSNNKLTNLDTSSNTALNTLAVSYNEFTNLDVSSNTALYTLMAYSNKLTSLDVFQNTALKRLVFTNNEITNIDVSKNIILEELSCDNNNLTNLDLSQNTALRELRCNYNQLIDIDVSQLTNLELFGCVGNQLTSLDISQNTALRTLNCGANQLTYLSIVGNTELRSLHCYQNQLTALNLANGNNSILTNMSATENNLNCIQIDEGFTPPGDSWLKDDTASYSTNCP